MSKDLTKAEFNHYRRVVGTEVPIYRIVDAPDGSGILHLGIGGGTFSHDDVKGEITINVDGSLVIMITSDPGTSKSDLGPRFEVKTKDVIQAAIRAYREKLPFVDDGEQS